MNAVLRPSLAWVCVATVSSSFTFCNAQSPGAPQSLSTSSTLHVEQAEIKCMHKVSVAAQADGLIDAMMAEEGSSVKKGDVLLRIDNRLATAELEVAKKELEAADAQGKQTAHIDFAVASEKVAIAEYNELKDLFEQSGSASFSEVRKKLLEAERSQAGVKVAQVDHQKDQFVAEVAREKVKAAEVQLQLREVTSPRDGVIVERLRDQGEWVKAGEPIFRLLHLNEMKVEVILPARGISIAQLQNAPMKVRVQIGGGQELVFDARIDFVNSQIEVNDDVRVWARIQNQMLGDSWVLRDGMKGSVDITISQPALAATRTVGN